MTIEKLHEFFLSSTGITTDSRNCIKDSLFFALKGDNFNGNQYALTAIEKGCSYAIVDEVIDTNEKRLIRVENTLCTLQKLANYHRNYLKTPILAITGTNGKTTTKELINAVVSSSFATIATEGNLNNHIGVPLTLLQLRKNHQYGIIEMGANHIGEIELLCQIAEPNMGMITNVGIAHLEGFGSFEGVKKAKGELYNYLHKTKGKIILNFDNQELRNMADGLEYLSYSTKSNFGIVQCIAYQVTPYLEIKFKLSESNNIYEIKSNLIGSYNLENILAAITIGILLKIQLDKIISSIENYKPTNNRSQLTTTKDNTLLIDCYNANPSSMMVALTNFKEINHPKKMMILGEMREMGDNSAEEHVKLINTIKETGISDVFLVGKEFLRMQDIPSYYKLFSTSDELRNFLEKNLPKNNIILIKGSRGNKLEKIIDLL